MPICACGCSQEIPHQKHHSYYPVRYIPGHAQKLGLQKGQIRSTSRITSEVSCACGCGQTIPMRYPNGKPRYSRSADGIHYIQGHNPAKSGPDSHKWKGGRTTQRGYILVHCPDHPSADASGYVPEHRLMWEKANGRYLQSYEHIHHINGNVSDNCIDNLIALSIAEHKRLHVLADGGIPATREQKQAAGRKGAASRWSSLCP